MNFNMIRIMCTLVFAISLVVMPSAARGVTVKFATVAPEGSTWLKIIRKATEEITKKTSDRVKFKLYPGGIAGDEPDVIRKMRVGQYHSAGFTGVGLGDILSDIRVMDLPFFFKNLDEVDYVRGKLTPYFEKKFKEKGFVLLGWAEPGLVYVFTKEPVQQPSDMQKVKMWVWEGDPLAEEIIRAYKIVPVPVAMPDVLMALQTGMITGIYSSPLATMALQWHTKIKYMTSEPMTNATGAILISLRQWKKIKAADQKVVREVMKRHLEELMVMTRKQNNEAIEAFKKMGIKIAILDKKGKKEMFDIASGIRPKLVGKLYSKELLTKAEKLLTEIREGKTGINVPKKKLKLTKKAGK